MPTPDISNPDVIADALAVDGYAVMPDYLPAQEILKLSGDVHHLRDSGNLRRAGVGQGAEFSVNNDLRGDFVHWLDHDAIGAPYRQFLDHIEMLRQVINRSLMLGLFEFEGHYALYPKGAYYRKHLDQFQHDSRRTLTTILYLNHAWREEDGGQLRLYLNGEEPQSYRDIYPVGGTLVTFLSSRFWHEVMPANRDRVSLTGWFKTRG